MNLTRISAFATYFLFGALASGQALAQTTWRPPSDPATGETYHVEFSGGLWNATPAFVVSSEALGIRGTNIDFVSDLGVARKSFPEAHLVLRASQKHKFRLDFVPIKYTLDATVVRDLIFNGQRFRAGIPVTGLIEWRAWRFGYEYDFIYRDRGFVGFIAEAKYTDVSVTLASPIGLDEFTQARAPIPAIGGIGRVYVAPNISATVEITGFKLEIDEANSGRYIEVDVYGTLNFTDNVGVKVGYRSLDVGFRVDLDEGDLKLKGIYVSGVVRF